MSFEIALKVKFEGSSVWGKLIAADGEDAIVEIDGKPERIHHLYIEDEIPFHTEATELSCLPE